jgi:hypothetical protein
MKKYLIKGLLALFVGGIAASCADHDVDYVPLAQKKTQAYEQTFKEMIGGDVDPNQNWGFTGVVDDGEAVASARAKTRVDDCGWSMTKGFSETFSRAVIGKVLAALPEDIYADSKLNDYEFESNGAFEFCIVYAITSAADKVGYYYYDPNENPDNYGGKNNPVYKEFVSNIQNTNHKNDSYYFQYGFYDGNWETPIITPWPLEGATEDWGKEPWTCKKLYDMGEAQDKVRAKKFTLNIKEGYHFGFYVVNGENTMYSKKSRNGDNKFHSAVATLSDDTYAYAVGLEDWWDGPDYGIDCNDIVMLIKKSEKKPDIINYGQTVTTKTIERKVKKTLMAQGRVFCEDLGAAGRKDIDFNDIVFDARIWKHHEFDEITINGERTRVWEDSLYKAEICMLAAGGTIPAKMGNSTNIHDMFEGNYGQTTMINTVDDNADVTVTWENMSANPGAKIYTYKNNNEIGLTSIINALKDANPKHTITVNDIPISVLWQTSDDPENAKLGSDMETVGELHANPGLVPHKICLPIGTKWPSERRSIIEAYPDFASWASLETDANKDFYNHDNKDDGAIYHGTGWDSSLPMTDPYGVTFANNDSDLGKIYYELISSRTETVTTNSYTPQEGDVILWQPAEGSTEFDFGYCNTLDIPEYENYNDMNGGKVMIIGSDNGNGNAPQIKVYKSDYSRVFIEQTSFNGYAEFNLQYGNDKNCFGGGSHIQIQGWNMKLNYVIYRPQ